MCVCECVYIYFAINDYNKKLKSTLCFFMNAEWRLYCGIVRWRIASLLLQWKRLIPINPKETEVTVQSIYRLWLHNKCLSFQYWTTRNYFDIHEARHIGGVWCANIVVSIIHAHLKTSPLRRITNIPFLNPLHVWAVLLPYCCCKCI